MLNFFFSLHNYEVNSAHIHETKNDLMLKRYCKHKTNEVLLIHVFRFILNEPNYWKLSVFNVEMMC